MIALGARSIDLSRPLIGSWPMEMPAGARIDEHRQTYFGKC
jgi:hypothetical protein